ncbi:hypothetical protein F2Q68_00039900 [Brassica cretica]|uniref:Uncharacterized protein n=1 Tax=Brassica cretica TaxID=69181 RepID=A0A8S9MR13_BRACR|nr:hypothetical protein F2Q68_00039900 [Brassica cretica]
MPFSSQRWPDLLYFEDQENIISQTQCWRPGDFVLLLEALHNPFRSTRTHWIRQILEEYNQIKQKLNMESWINNWFNHYQTKIWRPGDILHLPEEPEDIIRAFKMQNIKRRRIWSSLPYLDSSSIFVEDLQRLFPSFYGALKIHSVNKDIPRPFVSLGLYQRAGTASSRSPYGELGRSHPARHMASWTDPV